MSQSTRRQPSSARQGASWSTLVEPEDFVCSYPRMEGVLKSWMALVMPCTYNMFGCRIHLRSQGPLEPCTTRAWLTCVGGRKQAWHRWCIFFHLLLQQIYIYIYARPPPPRIYRFDVWREFHIWNQPTFVICEWIHYMNPHTNGTYEQYT